MKLLRCLCCVLVVFTVSACSEVELASHVGKKIITKQDNSKSKGRYKVGSPYTIKGKRYYPKVDYGYDKTGIASWYGPGFHGKMTANGEVFDENDLTAAHKTLPLPSIVRVTNLENGRSLIVRVNDRGPYAHGRIIDMSKRSSELLGFRSKGVAKVRVEVLEAESRMVAQAAKNGQDTRGMEVEMNRPSYQSPKVESAVLTPQGYDENGGVQASLEDRAAGTSLPGHMKDGAFYPDPVIAEHPVTAHDIFVQVGSFSTREGAMKAASALDSYGRAQVYPALVDGQQYYRVRFPSSGVGDADMLLKRLVHGGHANAMIVVD